MCTAFLNSGKALLSFNQLSNGWHGEEACQMLYHSTYRKLTEKSSLTQTQEDSAGSWGAFHPFLVFS